MDFLFLASLTYRKLRLKIKDERLENYGFFKPTDEVFFSWQKTDEVAQILKSKVIVFQYPASFKPEKENLENLKKFFKKIKGKDHIFCWEQEETGIEN